MLDEPRPIRIGFLPGSISAPEGLYLAKKNEFLIKSIK
jgi:hypothetical protein